MQIHEKWGCCACSRCKTLRTLADVETGIAQMVCSVHGTVTQATNELVDNLRRKTGVTYDAINGGFTEWTDSRES